MRVRPGMRKNYGTGTRGFQRWMLVQFTGRNGAGTIAVTSTPSLVVGDIMCGVVRTSGATAEESSAFEPRITVAGNLQQSSASNLSANNYFAMVERRR